MKKKLGVATCHQCAEGVVWRAADSGSLSYTCQHCDFRAYAPAHSDAARAIAKHYAPDVDAEPVAAKKAAPKAEPKPEPKPEPKAEPKAVAPKPAGIWDHLTKKAAA